MPQQTFEELRFMILDPIKELDNFTSWFTYIWFGLLSGIEPLKCFLCLDVADSNALLID